MRKAIPDIDVLEVKFLLQEGDKMAWQHTLRSTHQKNLMGAPASGQIVEWREMVISRFEGDKIAEEWTASELAGELL